MLDLFLQGEKLRPCAPDSWLSALVGKDAWERRRITVWDARDTPKCRSALVLFFTKS